MLRRLLAAAALVAIAATRVSAGQLPAGRGLVVDEGGRPLAGVWIDPQGIETAADGTFAVAGPGTQRFTLGGYAPVLSDGRDLGQPVVMRRTARPPRLLPGCDRSSPGDGLMLLHVHTPKDVTVSSASHDDYFTMAWRRGESRMSLSAGPTMTNGLPSPEQVATLHDVTHRDVRLRVGSDELRISDVSGTNPNGTRYRYVGMFGEYFEYGATAADAAVFDRMLDAMCWVAIDAAAAPPSQTTPASSTAPSVVLSVGGDVKTPLTLSMDDLRTMLRRIVTIEEGQAKRVFAGVPLTELLTKAGAPIGPELHGPALVTYVLATASDGYRALFSVGELDLTTGGQDIIVADMENFQPMTPPQGPLRLVVKGDRRPARAIRMLERLEVVRLPPPTNAPVPTPH